MNKRMTIVVALASTVGLSLGISSHSFAAFGDNFGIADVNAPGKPVAPAFPTQKALWAGTCDLSSDGTETGGVGPASGGIAPPPARAHCIDAGDPMTSSGPPWLSGKEPSWRLDPVTQAAAHPDGTVAFWFNRGDVPGSQASRALPDGDAKNIIVRLPKGVVGNPEAVPKCPTIAAQAVPPTCGPESQVGVATLGLAPGAVPNLFTHPFYVTEARDTVTAELMIATVQNLFNIPVTARGRTNGDYGVDTLALLIPPYGSFFGSTVSLWGVPWAAEHDKWRIKGEDFAGINVSLKLASGLPSSVSGSAVVQPQSYDPSWGPIKPFFTNPTECSGSPLTLDVEMDSWQKVGSFVHASSAADLLVGCDKLDFDPQMTLRPDVKFADSPSGLDVELSIPQSNDPPAEALGNPNLPFDPDDSSGAPAYWKTDAGLATAHLKDTTVKLPTGTSFNPAAANGLQGCTTAQIGLTATSPDVTFDNEPHHCPDTAKIGTLEIVSPLLPDPLRGDVYAAPQDDNPFPGSLTAIYMVAQDYERGLSIKLPGKVDLDPATGQIATTFLDNPQLPFDTFRLKFKTGPRAPLNTPATCGQFKNDVDLTPWSFPHSGPVADVQDPFDIDAMPNGFGCVTEPEDRSFAPGFEAGSTNPQAGAHTDFVLNVTRRDGEQEISALTLDMPPGLTAKLAGTPSCPDASLAEIESSRTGLAESTAPLCPPASQVGTVNTLAGAGSLPLPTTGKLYLAGPYDPDGSGPKPVAPISVAAVVPAIAGGTPGDPAFDLGNVVARNAAYVDPKSAEVQVSSAKLPYIVGGVPLRVRRIAVDLNKPGFMLNPTNCSPFAVAGSIGGAADPLVAGDDTAAGTSSHFQVGNCEALGFKPKLSLRVKGKATRGSYQALEATLTARPGDANIGRAAVTMPHSLFLAQEHLNTICTRVQFAARACPPGSVYGSATAISPLLDAPLVGNVYLRASSNPLPDLVAALRGPDQQPIEIELVGRTDSVHDSLRNTFDVVPDAPVSSFTLKLKGGNKALLVTSTNLCRSKERPLAKFTAQNGRQLTLRPKLKTSCKGKARKKGKGAKRNGAGAKGKPAKKG